MIVWLIIALIVVVIFVSVYVQDIYEKRDNRLAGAMSMHARSLLDRTEARTLLERAYRYNMRSDSARNVTVGEALLESLPTTRWRQFEVLSSELLADQGWAVTVTRATADSGIDFTGLRPSGELAVGQAKHQKNPVSQPVVQAALGAAVSEGASLLVITTSSSFTRQAREWVERTKGSINIQLWDRKTIVDMLDNIEPNKLEEFVSKFVSGSSKGKFTNMLSLGSELTQIEQKLQDAVGVEFGQLPACWYHKSPMRVHLEGQYQPQIWWTCTEEYCRRVRGDDGTRFIRQSGTKWSVSSGKRTRGIRRSRG